MGGPVVAEQFGLPPYESLLDKGVYIINTRVYETLLDDDGRYLVRYRYSLC